MTQFVTSSVALLEPAIWAKRCGLKW